jgi:hypothetical protein
MFPATLALFSCLASLPVSPPDRSALTNLHQVIEKRNDKKAWFVNFERQLPPSNIPTWQRLQRQFPAYSRQYAELSFALAYYGVDYDANLRRVIRPYLVWNAHNTQYIREYGEDWMNGQLNSLEAVITALNLLYLKHHDVQSLSQWLGLRLDGAPAEMNADDLAELWKRHKTDLLRAASTSPARLQSLAEALYFEHLTGTERDKQLVKAQAAEIRNLADRYPEPLAATARKLARLIETNPYQNAR